MKYEDVGANNHSPIHRQSIRLKGYDYSRAGAYFVTICCNDRQYLFGYIVERKYLLNNAGKFATKCWLEIPKHFPRVTLDKFIVMVNHITMSGNGIIMNISSATKMN